MQLKLRRVAVVLLAGLPAAMPAAGGVSVVSANFGVETPGCVDGVAAETNGSFLIYGGFELVDGRLFPNVARLRPDGSVDPAWRPNPAGMIAKALPAADGVYLAGNFERIADTPWFFLAKVNRATGALIPAFNPAPDEPVTALAMRGNALYAGGSFTNIGGQNRPMMARLEPATGAAVPGFTNGPAFGQVYTLALDETGLYPGGVFFDIGGETRPFFAKVSVNSGNAIPGVFTNGADNLVHHLYATGNYVYACGYFEEIGGALRSSFARLHRNSGNADTNFTCGFTNPAEGLIWDCAVTPGAVFVGGDFSNYAGAAKQCIAKINATDGALVPAFTAQVNNAILGLAALPNGDIAAVGDFTQVNGQPAGGVAVFDAATGAHDPAFTSRVTEGGQVKAAVQMADGGWIVGGDFKLVRGVDMPYLARFNADGTLRTNWAPRPDAIVSALASDGVNLYVGGEFTQIAGQSRTNLAKLRLDTGAADPAFTAGANGNVLALAWSGGALYAGGTFAVIGGGARKCLAKLSPTTGAYDPAFTADADDYVTEVVPDGGQLYVCGAFTQINAAACGRVTRVNPATGAPDPAWTNGADARISGMAVTPAAVYVGGDFTNIGGVARNTLAKLSKSSGRPDPAWNPGGSLYVFTMQADNQYVYVGGNFDELGGYPITNAGRIALDTGVVDTNWTPMPDGAVYGFQSQAPYVFMFGNFLRVAGVLQQGFAALTHALPRVAITNPAPEMDHWRQSAASIELQAEAQADTGLAVTQVVYFANGARIGAAAAAPYKVIWAPVYEGQYAVTAVAYDQWGIAGTSAVPVNITVEPLIAAADFDGDGKADPAMYVIPPGTDHGSWYIWRSSVSYARLGPVLEGALQTVPLAGDLDGDRLGDPVLWWEAYVSGAWQNAWYAWRSSQNYAGAGPTYLGASGMAPVLADFDGDGKADPGINNDDSVNNIWRVWRSSMNYADSGDVRLGALCAGTPLAADFDGDGLADPAKVDGNDWRVWMSSANYQMQGPYTLETPAEAHPLAADFDGDGKADPAMYISTGAGYCSGWYAWLSSANYRRYGPYAFSAP